MSTVQPGTILAGKYRVIKVLGEGGMGIVVAALHVQLDQLVALKFMLPAALGSPEAVSRFLREARAAVKLKSEHVARVTDVGTLESGAPYIVMEYLEGTDLAGVLASRGALPPEEAVDYILQACDALAEAHSLGIVHRDLKPANLFLTRRRDGSALVKVLDFGISKSSTLNESGTESLTKTGGIMGSPLYMSPEQMKSAKTADARTDVWALGIILYELVGGRAPFDADTLGGLMAQVLTEEPPPLPTLRPGLPLPLYDAIAKALEKDRDKRWASVAELAIALAPIAPPGTQPIVERICATLGSVPKRSSLHASGSSPDISARAGRGATAPGWAEASTAPKSLPGRRGLAIGVAVAGAAVLVALIAGAISRRGDAPGGARSLSAAARGSAAASLEGPLVRAPEAPPVPDRAPPADVGAPADVLGHEVVDAGSPVSLPITSPRMAATPAGHRAPLPTAATLPRTTPPPAPPAIATSPPKAPTPTPPLSAASKPATDVLDTSN